MADELMATGEEVPVPTSPAEPLDAEASPETAGSVINFTIDDIPELADLQIGDSLSFQIDDISEDGNYSLSVSQAAIEEAPLPAGEELPATGGREAVLAELTA